MTLTKAIEAARCAMENTSCYCDQCDAPDQCINCENRDKALAALPDKPMSEDELVDKLDRDCCVLVDKSSIVRVIRALKAANVLYVSEDK